MLDSNLDPLTPKRKFLGVFVNVECVEKLTLYSIVHKVKKSEILRNLIEQYFSSIDKEQLISEIAKFLKRKRDAEILLNTSTSHQDFNKYWERILISKGLSADTIELIFKAIE